MTTDNPLDAQVTESDTMAGTAVHSEPEDTNEAVEDGTEEDGDDFDPQEIEDADEDDTDVA